MSQPQPMPAPTPPSMPRPPAGSFTPSNPLSCQDPTDKITALGPRNHGLVLRSIQEADIQRCSYIISQRPFSERSNPQYSILQHPYTAPSGTTRLMKELSMNANDPVPFVSFAPISDDNLFHMIASIEGPFDSPYEGGVFYMKLDFDSAYPYRPPKCVFLTKIYHPNISPRGEICMDVLWTAWSPVYTIQSLLVSICALLSDPFFPNSFTPELAELYAKDREKYDANARQYTRKWATGVRPEPSVFEEAGKSGLDVTWEDYAEDSDGLESLVAALEAKGKDKPKREKRAPACVKCLVL